MILVNVEMGREVYSCWFFWVGYMWDKIVCVCGVCVCVCEREREGERIM